MIKVAINGFGRIGRLALREMIKSDQLDVVAINDLTSTATLAYLLKYDSSQGRFDGSVSHSEKGIIVNGKLIPVSSERDPNKLPWLEADVDIVLECTGIFDSRDKSLGHLNAGAKKVIISAPAGKDVKTIVFNTNHQTIDNDDRIISCASCTTNGLAPMAKALQYNFGIVVGQMTTIHAYTNSQPLLDTPDPSTNLRRSRAAADSIIPYSTGAAKAIGLVIPELDGKLDGSSQRVPVSVGSVVELFTILEKRATVSEINSIMQLAANESFGYTEDEIVSADIIGMSYGSLFDASQTNVVTLGDQQLVKTVSWYDNEMSFVSQLVRTTAFFGSIK